MLSRTNGIQQRTDGSQVRTNGIQQRTDGSQSRMEVNDIVDVDFFPQRAPNGGSSSGYIGLRSSNIIHSSNNFQSSSNIIHSSNNFQSSSSNFSSSNDILEYLSSHPDYQKMPPSQLEAVLAAIVSGLLIVGGVALIVVSGGTATPGVILSSSLLLGTGVSGMQNAIQGAINRNFSWANWAQEGAISAGLTLVTFGAGYGAGNLVGIALKGTNLSASCIKAIGTAAGAIAGSGIRTGAFIVVKFVKGEALEAFELIMEGVGGAIEGGFAGYLGAKMNIASKAQIVEATQSEPIADIPDGEGGRLVLQSADGSTRPKLQLKPKGDVLDVGFDTVEVARRGGSIGKVQTSGLSSCSAPTIANENGVMMLHVNSALNDQGILDFVRRAYREFIEQVGLPTHAAVFTGDDLPRVFRATAIVRDELSRLVGVPIDVIHNPAPSVVVGHFRDCLRPI